MFNTDAAIFMLISSNLHDKARSTPVSLSLKGHATKHTTIKIRSIQQHPSSFNKTTLVIDHPERICFKTNLLFTLMRKFQKKQKLHVFFNNSFSYHLRLKMIFQIVLYCQKFPKALPHARLKCW